MRTVRPNSADYSTYFGTYIREVPDGDIVAHLRACPLALCLREFSEDSASQPPAPGKWSPKQVLGHVSDTERVFAYRALRIARGDQTPLPGFEQDPFVANAGFDRRTLADLIEEFAAVRQSTILLVEHFDPAAWKRRGAVSGMNISVRGLVWAMAGHERHHSRLLA
jgi:hypothetical protein